MATSVVLWENSCWVAAAVLLWSMRLKDRLPEEMLGVDLGIDPAGSPKIDFSKIVDLDVSKQ